MKCLPLQNLVQNWVRSGLEKYLVYSLENTVRRHLNLIFVKVFLQNFDQVENLVRSSLVFEKTRSLIEMLCRTHDSAMQTQSQGHTLRSWDLPFIVMSAPYLLKDLKDFH